MLDQDQEPEQEPEQEEEERLIRPPYIWARLPPIEYCVGPCSVGDVAMLVARGGSCKSWILTQAVLARAAGAPFLEQFPTSKGTALYIDFEQGEEETRRRFQRTARGMGFTEPIENCAIISFPRWDLATSRGIARIAHFAQEFDLVCIDSLSAGSPGVDEKDAKFADALKRLKALAQRQRCAILILHHTRKERADEDIRDAARGSSALFDACDVVIQLRRVKRGFLLQQTKARRGREMPKLYVRVEDTSEQGTRVWGEDAEEGASVETPLSRALVAVRAALDADPGLRDATARVIVSKVSGRREFVLEAIRRIRREQSEAAEESGTGGAVPVTGTGQECDNEETEDTHEKIEGAESLKNTLSYPRFPEPRGTAGTAKKPVPEAPPLKGEPDLGTATKRKKREGKSVRH